MRAEYARQRNDITRANGQSDPMKASASLLGASYGEHPALRAEVQLPRRSLHRRQAWHPHLRALRPDVLGTRACNWWFGANGAYSWLNANLRAQRFIVDAYFSPQDIVQFQFVRASADQLNSAVQYGQGVRFTSNGLLVGAPKAKLSDEIYLQYARAFNPTRWPSPSWRATRREPG